MTDRSTVLLLDRLKALAARKARFAYDVRGHSYVTTGVVAPYAPESGREEGTDLAAVLRHALEHDGVVSGVRGADGRVRFTSCRLFTDVHNALVFARGQRQVAVYNWNREEEVPVEGVGVQGMPARG